MAKPISIDCLNGDQYCDLAEALAPQWARTSDAQTIDTLNRLVANAMGDTLVTPLTEPEAERLLRSMSHSAPNAPTNDHPSQLQPRGDCLN